MRRNKLSDFVNVNRAGKIAMKLDEGDAIVDVQICTEGNDVLLTTALGQCIRFPVPDVRVFKGRDSHRRARHHAGKDDIVISMAILRHLEATPMSAPPISSANAAAPRRRSERRCPTKTEAVSTEEATEHIEVDLGEQRYVEMSACRAVHPDHLGERLRQAHLVLRVPGHRARRQGHRRHGRQRAQWQADRLLPGRGQRPDHAGHRWRPAHPLPGRRYPHRRPLDAGRHVFNTADDEQVVSVEHIGDDGEGEAKARPRPAQRRRRAAASDRRPLSRR
jgi:DNA gyrase subunit A